MTSSGIVDYRLINQQIAETQFTEIRGIVRWMGAMQAQEYAMAKWAIGLRLPGLKDADLEKAFNDGTILRTHMLRPTWHFVDPADIRWMLKLTAPRVHAASAYMYRKLELNSAFISRTNDALAKILQGGKHCTRTELKAALDELDISADGLRLGYILMCAELEGIICSGPRLGKQFSYGLLDERAPAARTLDREEALAELCRRYFRSRGPATLRDFVWWSGLTMKDAKAGAAMLSADFLRETIDGQEYIFAPVEAKSKPVHQRTFLLPDYDEYGISYKDRSAIFRRGVTQGKGRGNSIFDHMIVLDGVIAGTWQRTVQKNGVAVEISPFNPLSKPEQKALTLAVGRYIEFLEGDRQ